MMINKKIIKKMNRIREVLEEEGKILEDEENNLEVETNNKAIKDNSKIVTVIRIKRMTIKKFKLIIKLLIIKTNGKNNNLLNINKEIINMKKNQILLIKI